MSEFFEHSKGIVEDFLQTAVFLDDEATFKDNEEIKVTQLTIPKMQVPKDTENVVTPKEETTTIQIEGKFTEAAVDVSEKENDKSHLLDAKKIIDTFMKKGIICSVLKCEQDTYSSLRGEYIKLLKKADIIVLDWNLFSDNGNNIIELIKELITTDAELRELRSIVIYTAHSLDGVKKRLEEEGIVFDNYLSTNNKYTSISLFSKNSKDATEERKVEFDVLVDACIDEFTNAFNGIIPNMAMASIAEIRTNTHKLLGVLNKDLDVGFISHRLLLENKDDAREHIINIIGKEFESILQSNDCCQSNFDDSINKWINSNTKYINTEIYQSLLETPNQCNINDFTSNWHNNSLNSDNDFSILTLINNNYNGTHSIKLTTGTILKKEQAYFLCITPRCDCERISRGGKDFIFIKLSKVIEDEKPFNILIKDNSEYIKLRFVKDLSKITVCKFKPTEKNRPIFSTINDGKHTFKTKDGIELLWASELKREQSQRISNEIATHISRVGLNESEYLRRSSLK